MKLQDVSDVLNKDWPTSHPITQATVDAIKRDGRREYYVGNARMATGRVYTDAEYEARRARVLATPLP